MKRLTDVYHTARQMVGSSALLLALLAAPGIARAQTLFGTPANFDVYNDTGQVTHGFEIELDGLTSANVGGAYGFRYATSTIVDIPGGVVIRFSSPYINNAYSISTQIPAAFLPTGGHSCTFSIAGCEHFGYYLPYYGIQPSRTVYRWLADDPQNPGNLIPATGSSVQVPPVTVTVTSAANGGAPVVAFEIPILPPPPPRIPQAELQFGEAKWVKVLKNEVQHNVVAPDLLEDNPVVPADNNPGQVETEWKLLQFNPHSANSGVLHHQAVLGQGSKAVIRKYEFYKFSGAYDVTSHKAICGGDGLCNAPLDGELGDFIGNQMAAANLGNASITVTPSGTGSGTVTGAGKINCGGTCSTPLALQTAVTLTAKAASKSVFTGWSGDCAGTQATCTFTITGENNVTANFDLIAPAGGGGGGGGAVGGGGGGGGNASFKVSVSRNGSGTVTTDPATASFAPGTVVTLTATPAAGQPWIGWGGACAGTSVTCTLTMDANKSVIANFR